MSEQQLDLEMWKQRVEAYEKSGLSKAQFCRERQLSAPTFWYYYRKFNPLHKPVMRESVSGFIPLKSALIPSAAAEVSLHFASGIKVTIPAQVNSHHLLKLLEVMRSC